MARILEIHYENKAPEMSEEESEKVKEDLEATLKYYPDTELKEILVSDEGIAVEEWEAPDSETVEEIIEKVLGSDHCDKVVEVEPMEP